MHILEHPRDVNKCEDRVAILLVVCTFFLYMYNTCITMMNNKKYHQSFLVFLLRSVFTDRS